jgi:hypothetical protein
VRRTVRLLALVLAGLAGAGTHAAVGQALITQPQRYLLTTDAYDGRALWTQPAGLARRRESSIAWSFTGESRDGIMTLEQYGLTFASRGVAIGWQRAELVDDTEISQWALGYAGGGPRASVGVVRRWVKGRRANDAVWDFGARVIPRPFLEVEVAWRDVGSIVVQSSDTATSSPDTTYSPTLIPAAALTLLNGRARLGAEVDLLTTDWKRRAARAGAAVALPFGLGLHARAAFDGELAFETFSVALTWSGTSARVTGFGQFPERSGGARHYGLWGAAVRDLEPRRPGWR